MVKVTHSLAFSSQPTEKQIKGLKTFGFNSLLNLRRHCRKESEADRDGDSFRTSVSRYLVDFDNETSSFLENEEDLAVASGLAYMSFPIDTDLPLSEELIQSVMQVIDKLPKPLLVHCVDGQLSSMMILYHSALSSKADSCDQIFDWAVGLGFRIDLLPESVLEMIKGYKKPVALVS